MLKKNVSPKIKYAIYVILAVYIVLWPLQILNKGIDVSDTGYILSKYAFFPNYFPDISILFSELIGNIIYSLSNSYNLLIIKLFTWLSYLIIFTICFLIFKDYSNNILLLLSCIISSFFAMSYFVPFSYHSMHILLFCISILLLINSLKKDKNIYLILSSLIIAFNIFIRIPNILEVSLFFVIIWYYFFCMNEKLKSFKKTTLFLFAFTIFAILFFFYCLYLISYDKTLKGLKALFTMASNTDDSHGISNMFASFANTFFSGFILLIKTSIVPLLISIFIFIAKKNLSLNIIKWFKVLLVLPLIITAWWFFKTISYREYIYLVAATVFIFCSIGIILYKKTKPMLSVLFLISCIIICAETFGTNNGLSYVRVFLVFPLMAISCLYKTNLSDTNNHSTFLNLSTKQLINVFLNYFIVLIIFLGLLCGFQIKNNHVYRDLPYNQLTEYVNLPVLKGMKTSPKRAEQLENIVFQLSSFKGQTLIVYGNMPILYSLVDMEPCLSNPWPDLEPYKLDTMKQDIEKTIAEKNAYPVIVFAHIDDMAIRDQLQDEVKKDYLNSFVVKNGYTLVYQDDYFKIYSKDKINLSGE